MWFHFHPVGVILLKASHFNTLIYEDIIFLTWFENGCIHRINSNNSLDPPFFTILRFLCVQLPSVAIKMCPLRAAVLKTSVFSCTLLVCYRKEVFVKMLFI